MTLPRILAGVTAAALGLPAIAQDFSQIARIEVLPGWETADGTRMAAVRVELEPGWKTYWRAPGDAGIPPQFSWAGSRNMGGLEMSWPTPEVFDQNGMRSIGYEDEMVLPIEISPRGDGPVRVKGSVDIGICRDVCVPQTLEFDALLPGDGGQRDPRIIAALVDQPYSAAEAGVSKSVCRVSATQDGIALRAEVLMPPVGGREIAVIETGNPDVWVAEPRTRREGNTLIAETTLSHIDGAAFALNRSDVRITVIGAGQAVDISGCLDE